MVARLTETGQKGVQEKYAQMHDGRLCSHCLLRVKTGEEDTNSDDCLVIFLLSATVMMYCTSLGGVTSRRMG